MFQYSMDESMGYAHVPNIVQNVPHIAQCVTHKIINPADYGIFIYRT